MKYQSSCQLLMVLLKPILIWVISHLSMYMIAAESYMWVYCEQIALASKWTISWHYISSFSKSTNFHRSLKWILNITLQKLRENLCSKINQGYAKWHGNNNYKAELSSRIHIWSWIYIIHYIKKRSNVKNLDSQCLGWCIQFLNDFHFRDHS